MGASITLRDLCQRLADPFFVQDLTGCEFAHRQIHAQFLEMRRFLLTDDAIGNLQIPSRWSSVLQLYLTMVESSNKSVLLDAAVTTIPGPDYS